MTKDNHVHDPVEIAKSLGEQVRKAGFTAARGSFKSKLPKKVGPRTTPKNAWAQGQQSLRGKTSSSLANPREGNSLRPNIMTSHKKWRPPA